MKKWQKRYQKDHPDPQKLKFCMKKNVFFYSKRPPSPAKSWSFEWKMPKNWQKIDQKNEKPPQKTRSFAWKIENCPTYGDFEKLTKKCQKKVPKRARTCSKSWRFAWKIENHPTYEDFEKLTKVPKKGTKKSTYLLKKLKFCMKNWKSSYLWGFWKKNSRPPTSPNFKTHKRIILHNRNYIACKVYTYPITYLSFIKI